MLKWIVTNIYAISTRFYGRGGDGDLKDQVTDFASSATVPRHKPIQSRDAIFLIRFLI